MASNQREVIKQLDIKYMASGKIRINPVSIKQMHDQGREHQNNEHQKWWASSPCTFTGSIKSIISNIRTLLSPLCEDPNNHGIIRLKDGHCHNVLAISNAKLLTWLDPSFMLL